MDIEEEKKRLWEIAKQSAISYWSNVKNGIYRNDSDKEFSVQYCKVQIDYFKKLTK